VRRLALLLALLVAPRAAAQEAAPSSALSLDEYRAALESMAAGLEGGDWEGARALAGALRGATVSAAGGPFETDPSLVVQVIGKAGEVDSAAP
jgi:DNA-binding GntR family transcriptional regulator